jgi:FecR protein
MALVVQKRSTVAPGEVPHPVAQSSTLVLSSGAKVLVSPGSDVRVERDDERETSIRLGSGRVLAHVKKRAGRPFVVHSDDVRVEVRGTTFAVEAREASIVAVGVWAGRVRVSRADQSWEINPGQSWPTDATPLAMTAEERAWASAEESASAESPPDELPAPAEEHAAPSVTSPEKPASGPKEASPYAAAKQRESRGDLQGALSSYEAIAASSDKNAEDARFAVGRLRAKLGDTGGALEAFRLYREHYEAGGYARAVDVHVLDLLLAQGNDDAVLGEASRFLQAHPDDPRAWRFRMARASIRIKKGDCPAAMSDLSGVPEREAKPLRERCTPGH